MTNAPIKLPKICEDMKKAQKMPLKIPLLSEFAHSEMYLPWATQSMAAPNPFIAAAVKIINVRIGLFIELVLRSGLYEISATMNAPM